MWMLYYLGTQERATKYRGVEQMVARRAHNPEVAGSSPVPATTKTPLSSRKAVFFSALLQLWGTSPFPGHRGDPNRDPDWAKT